MREAAKVHYPVGARDGEGRPVMVPAFSHDIRIRKGQGFARRVGYFSCHDEVLRRIEQSEEVRPNPAAPAIPACLRTCTCRHLPGLPGAWTARQLSTHPPVAPRAHPSDRIAARGLLAACLCKSHMPSSVLLLA